MVALNEPNNLLNPFNYCKGPSSTLLLYNTNHKNYLKTILPLNHLYHEWNHVDSYWLTVLQQVNNQQEPFSAFCNTIQPRPVHWSFLHKEKLTSQEWQSRFPNWWTDWLGFSQLHKHYHTPGLNYIRKIQNRYLSNIVITILYLTLLK